MRRQDRGRLPGCQRQQGRAKGHGGGQQCPAHQWKTHAWMVSCCRLNNCPVSGSGRAVAWIRHVASVPKLRRSQAAAPGMRKGPLLVPLLVSPLSDPSKGPGVRGGRRGGRPSGPSESGRAGVAYWRPCALRFKTISLWMSRKAAPEGCPPGKSLWKSCPPDTCCMHHR